MILDPQSKLFHSSTCLQVLPDHVPLSLGSADYTVWQSTKWWKKTGDDPEERTHEEWEPTPEEIEAFGVEQDGDVFCLVKLN